MKRLLLVLGRLAALLLVAAIATPFLIDVNRFRPRLEAALTEDRHGHHQPVQAQEEGVGLITRRPTPLMYTFERI